MVAHGMNVYVMCFLDGTISMVMNGPCMVGVCVMDVPHAWDHALELFPFIIIKVALP